MSWRQTTWLRCGGQRSAYARQSPQDTDVLSAAAVLYTAAVARCSDVLLSGQVVPSLALRARLEPRPVRPKAIENACEDRGGCCFARKSQSARTTAEDGRSLFPSRRRLQGRRKVRTLDCCVDLQRRAQRREPHESAVCVELLTTTRQIVFAAWCSAQVRRSGSFSK